MIYRFVYTNKLNPRKNFNYIHLIEFTKWWIYTKNKMYITMEKNNNKNEYWKNFNWF